jgi:PAS domain S-box-containing protein
MRSVPAELFQLMAEQARDYALFLLDPAGNVMTWNIGAKLAKGYEAEEIIGKHFSIFYTPDSIASGWPQKELAQATREGHFEDEGWRVRKDGTRFWANVVITALRDKSGRLVAFSKITRDLTERRRHDEEMRQSEERFRLLVEGVVDYAIYLLNPDGIVTSWNVGAERIKGYRRDEIIGRHYSNFFLPEDVAAGKPWEELVLARQQGRAEVEGWRLRKNGERFWARVVVSALHDTGGRLVGFAKVTQDLTQHRRVHELETTAQQINEFVAMLAHEIRNPLAPIQSALNVLRIAKPGEANFNELRDIIERQTRRLSRIADDMVDVSRITRGSLSIRRDRVSLEQVIKVALEATAPLVRERRHSVEVDTVGAGETHGDLERLVQVFSNLLTNAAKYTQPGGRIRIRAAADEQGPRISISDNGRGVPADELQSIFQMFVQGRSQLERVDTGMGVGLAVARSLVELHGGSLEAHSEGVGKGSEFIVHLPAFRDGDSPTAEKPAEQAATPARRILIVEDNPDAARTLDLLLRGLGHETRVAHEGSQALEALDEFRPEIVLLDIGLPGLSGYEVAKRIRGRSHKNIRIVAVTGWGQPDDRRRSAEAGFDLHLTKPIDEQSLQIALRVPENGTLH